MNAFAELRNKVEHPYKRLSWVDVCAARWMRDNLNHDAPWLLVIAGAMDDSNLEAVKDEANKWLPVDNPREAGQGLVEPILVILIPVIIILCFLGAFFPGAVAKLAGISDPVNDVSTSLSYQSPVYAEDKLIEGLDSSEIGLVDMEYLVWYSAEHASDKHGDQLSWIIRDECERNPIIKMERPNGRKALGCEYEHNGERKFGVAIYEAWDDFVTSFPNKAKNLEELFQYLTKAGYTP